MNECHFNALRSKIGNSARNIIDKASLFDLEFN